jgi:hypothetical protein
MRLDLKSKGLVNLVEDIPWHLSLQAVAGTLLAAFKQVYIQNQSQKQSGKIRKLCSLARKGVCLKFPTKRARFLKRLG